MGDDRRSADGRALHCLPWQLHDRGGLKRSATSGKYREKPNLQTRLALVHLRDGFLIVFFNPKIIVFFLAVFSQFLSADQSVATQITAAAVAGVLDAAWYALVAIW